MKIPTTITFLMPMLCSMRRRFEPVKALSVVFVTGAGAEARNSIGIMLVSGMAIGTVFTLFILPAVYNLIAAEHQAEEPSGKPQEASA